MPHMCKYCPSYEAVEETHKYIYFFTTVFLQKTILDKRLHFYSHLPNGRGINPAIAPAITNIKWIKR